MTVQNDLIASDVEIAIVLWLKQATSIRDLVSGQVHFEMPAKTPPLPLITVSRVGGGLQSGEALIDDALISFSCWAKPFDKAVSARVAAAIRTAAFLLYRAPVTITTSEAVVTLHGAQVGDALWLPEQADPAYARHVVDAAFTTTSRAV